MSHRYQVYGTGLESAMEFPELRAEPGIEAKWRFHTAESLPVMKNPSELGAENIYADVHARLFRHSCGHRIVVDDTGEFDLSENGLEVTWQTHAAAWPDFVRAHLLGRVLATSMYNDGWLPLHGSAVELRDGIVAFLAPKGFGKSTLALALARAGAHLVTDDTLPIDLGRREGADAVPLAWPGVHSLRVRPDAATALGVDAVAQTTREGKWLVNEIPGDRRCESPRPLTAIYLIDPRVPAGGEPAARTLMPAMLAAIGVVAHVKIGRMLGSSAAGAMLERAAQVTTSVPVYHLHLARDLDLLPSVAGAVIDWHGGTT